MIVFMKSGYIIGQTDKSFVYDENHIFIRNKMCVAICEKVFEFGHNKSLRILETIPLVSYLVNHKDDIVFSNDPDDYSTLDKRFIIYNNYLYDKHYNNTSIFLDSNILDDFIFTILYKSE